MRNKNRPRRQLPAGPNVVHSAQAPCPWPTRPSKALVAGLVTLAGLVGIRLTHGTAELVVMLAQLLVVAYGVWRTHNGPKPPLEGPGVGEFL